jgi:hypothetical protein
VNVAECGTLSTTGVAGRVMDKPTIADGTDGEGYVHRSLDAYETNSEKQGRR